MKPYGHKGHHPKDADIVDIRKNGMPGHVGNLAGKGGDIRSSFKDSDKKAQIRRAYKKAERNRAKQDIQKQKDDSI